MGKRRSGLEDALRMSTTRRFATQSIVAGAGGFFLLHGAGRLDALLIHAQQNDDGRSGRGRGRGRGRGGREDGATGEDETIVITSAIPTGSIEIRIVSDDAGGFVPGDLTVDPGQSVTFVNAHHDEHTATGSGFDTGVIGPGGTATVALETPGVFPYACQFHPEMTGTVRVRDASGAVPDRQDAAAPDDAIPVSIRNLAFDPTQITVPTGATVVWTNDDTVPHTVTSAERLFDSGIFDPGSTFTWQFDQPGSFAYACQLHPQMQGVVVVEGEAAPAPIPEGPSPADGSGEAAGATAATPATEAHSSLRDLSGVWLMQIGPDSGSPFGDQHALFTFQPNGTLDADLAASTATDGIRLISGQGSWSPRAGGLGIALAVLAVDTAGAFSGLVLIDGELTLDANANALSGSFTWANMASDDAAESGIGTLRGERVALDP